MEATKLAFSSSTPLYPLTPERVNGTRLPHSAHHSHKYTPSVPEFGKSSMPMDPFSASFKASRPPFSHSRNNSDAMVQGMIARFDNMSIKDYKSNHENALKRVEMAREMAELENKKLKEQAQYKDEEGKKTREETRKVKKDLEDSKDRERKIARRLDVVMEELHRAKDTHDHTIAVYEKEIRKSKKENFKVSANLLKHQEELKSTRALLRATQANLESCKLKVAKCDQDTFTAQYQLVGVQEELQKALERIKGLEDEREALKLSLKEEEVSRVAAEGRIALPQSAEEDDMDLLASPSKSPRKASNPSDSEKENVVPKKIIQLKSLQQDLILEKRLRQKAQDQVEFMKMECQFQCCSCRIAEKTGTKYIHDETYLPEMERIKGSMPYSEPTVYEVTQQDFEEAVNTITNQQLHNPRPNPIKERDDFEVNGESLLCSTPTIIYEQVAVTKRASARKVTSIHPDESSCTIQNQPEIHVEVFEEGEEDELEAEAEDELEAEAEAESSEKPNRQALEPITPNARAFRTVTTTTTIPIMFSPAPSKFEATAVTMTPRTISHPGQYYLTASPFPSKVIKLDGTIDREAALELIRQRRGRAQSVAMGHATPKKQMVEGTMRRDISAPSIKTQTWTR